MTKDQVNPKLKWLHDAHVPNQTVTSIRKVIDFRTYRLHSCSSRMKEYEVSIKTHTKLQKVEMDSHVPSPANLSSILRNKSATGQRS